MFSSLCAAAARNTCDQHVFSCADAAQASRPRQQHPTDRQVKHAGNNHHDKFFRIICLQGRNLVVLQHVEQTKCHNVCRTLELTSTWLVSLEERKWSSLTLAGMLLPTCQHCSSVFQILHVSAPPPQLHSLQATNLICVSVRPLQAQCAFSG